MYYARYHNGTPPYSSIPQFHNGYWSAPTPTIMSMRRKIKTIHPMRNRSSQSRLPLHLHHPFPIHHIPTHKIYILLWQIPWIGPWTQTPQVSLTCSHTPKQQLEMKSTHRHHGHSYRCYTQTLYQKTQQIPRPKITIKIFHEKYTKNAT